MTALILILLGGWPTAYGRAFLDELHVGRYDLLRYDVLVKPSDDGLRIRCLLEMRVKQTGPVRLILSSEVEDLRVSSAGGKPIPAHLGDAGVIEKLARLLAPPGTSVPSLLRIDPEPELRPGHDYTFRFDYTWRPAKGGWYRARERDVQTHLSGFWVPSMADELFDARIEVHTRLAAFAPGTRTKIRHGWIFETTRKTQVLPLVLGVYHTSTLETSGGTIELWVPPRIASSIPVREVLRDLEQVLTALENRFGRRPKERFRLILDPRLAPAPSYCGGAFVVVPTSMVTDAPRIRWIEHLAHECSHAWWGHGLAFPLLGAGGTWMREGLAQWSGAHIAGAVLGDKAERALFRDYFRRYVASADLRRGSGGQLFANEPTLIDATYLDPASVAYLRGACVLNLFLSQRSLGESRRILRSLLDERSGHILEIDDFRTEMGAERLHDYYARTTRLPDLAVAKVEAEDGLLRAEFVCRDRDWPGATLPVEIVTDRETVRKSVEFRDGRADLEWTGEGTPKRLELDPDRLSLDPIGSNNVWTR